MSFSSPQLLETASKIVRKAEKLGAAQAEVLVYVRDDSVVRFSQNNISQCASYTDEGIIISVFTSNNNLGKVTVRQIENNAIESGVRRALDLANNCGKIKSLPTGFSRPKNAKSIPETFRRKTVLVTDAERAQLVKQAINSTLRKSNLIKRVSGTVNSRIASMAIYNSNGVELDHSYTGSSFVSVVLAETEGSTGVGFSSQASNDFSELDFAFVSEDASNDALKSIKPKAIPIGRYNVVFQPYAVLDWLGSFVQLGFSTQRIKNYVNIAEKCCSEKLTIVDDPTNPSTLMAHPFDAEGIPTKRLTLIRDGSAVAQCYDRKSAHAAGKRSTGHGSFPNDLTYESKFFPSWIYFPANQIVKPGRTTMEEMIQDSKKMTILVKRFMYGGLPMCVSETEKIQAYTMGTWLIEDGEIKHALPSLRMSDSLKGLASRIDSIGSNETVKRLGCMNAPCMSVNNVNFSVSTSMSASQGVM